MIAGVVYAYGIHAYDSATPVKMHWRCSCGGDGVDIPGDTAVCSGCRETVRVPEEPIDLTASSTEPAESAPQPTSTAWKLAAYRSELQACGFSPNDVRALLLIAARNTAEWTVGPLFLARAAPPAPIMRIENYEPGTPEDLAIRAEYGRLFIRMWDDATPEQRVEMAERVVTESEQARRCFLQNHKWRIENLRRAQEMHT